MITRVTINGQTMTLIPMTPLNPSRWSACAAAATSKANGRRPATAPAGASGNSKRSAAPPTGAPTCAPSVASSCQQASASEPHATAPTAVKTQPKSDGNEHDERGGNNEAGDDAIPPLNRGCNVPSKWMSVPAAMCRCGVRAETAVSPTIATQDAASPKCPANAAETAERLGSGR